jgi:hypothetical protein
MNAPPITTQGEKIRGASPCLGLVSIYLAPLCAAVIVSDKKVNTCSISIQSNPPICSIFIHQNIFQAKALKSDARI